MHLSLRTKILLVVLAAVTLTDALALWAVGSRLQRGAQRAAAQQATAHAAQLGALYRERAATLVAEAEAVALYPAVIAAIAEGNRRPLLQWSEQLAQRQHTTVT